MRKSVNFFEYELTGIFEANFLPFWIHWETIFSKNLCNLVHNNLFCFKFRTKIIPAKPKPLASQRLSRRIKRGRSTFQMIQLTTQKLNLRGGKMRGPVSPTFFEITGPPPFKGRVMLCPSIIWQILPPLNLFWFSKEAFLVQSSIRWHNFLSLFPEVTILIIIGSSDIWINKIHSMG